MLSRLYDSLPQTAENFMSNLYWLSEDEMGRLRPYFPLGRGRAHGYNNRVLSGIIFFNRNGLPWCVAPKENGPYKTL
jgi:transposase